MAFLDSLKRLGRKAVSMIAGKSVEEFESSEKDKTLLDKWRTIFAVDRQEKDQWDDRFDDWESLYAGNRVFENLTNDTDKVPRTLVNFPKRFIEQHIDLNVPEPDFKPVSQDDESIVKRLEAQVKYTVRAAQPSLEEMNQQDERRVRKLGGTFKKVHWNNGLKRAGYVGDVELSNPHPKDIIPNAGATSLEDMEHYHHVVNRTGNSMVRKWKHLTLDMLEKKAALHTEYDELTGKQDIEVSQESKHEADTGLAKYTVVETTYRDEDGDICKFWWSGDLPIEHTPKFYYRRGENGEPVSEETVTEPVKAFRQWGAEGPEFTEIPAGGKVPFYIPKSWDIVYQPFIPRDKCFWGMSVYEDVKDLLESIKKQIYAGEEEILRGRTKIFTTDQEIANRIKDPLSEVIVCQDLNLVKEVQFTGDLAGHMAWLELMKSYMQEIMGAENAVLGKASPNVTSGRQAEMYIAQAQTLTNVVTAAKIAAYKRLYRVIADFHLAFSDYDRPFRLDGAGPEGSDTYGVFNRLNMLRDRSGNFVYPDYDIEIGAESGFMRQKSEILQMLTWLASSGRFEAKPENLILLKIFDKMGVPHLKEAIKGIGDTIQQQRQAQEAQMQAQQAQQAQQQAQMQAQRQVQMQQQQGQPQAQAQAQRQAQMQAQVQQQAQARMGGGVVGP